MCVLRAAGDWGKQYGLLAVGYERYGDDAALAEDPIRHLYEVYVKINAVLCAVCRTSHSLYAACVDCCALQQDAEKDASVHDAARAFFKRMEDGDPTALGNWRRFRDLSIEAYKKVYERLNVTFDVYSGESQVGELMDEQVKARWGCDVLLLFLVVVVVVADGGCCRVGPNREGSPC